MAATASQVEVFRLSGASRITDQVRLLNALVTTGDPAWREGALTLARELLAPALEAVGRSVERLTIVADGPLHSVPFAALVEGNAAVALAPSASLWLDWRRASGPGARGALVVADPWLASSDSRAIARERGWRLEGLGALPYARREGRAVHRRIGGEGELLVGREATEGAVLARLAAAPPAVLHLAAHALVDGEDPGRSAIVLSPGAASDGLVTAGEIASARLPGALAVLSACETARGPAPRGEGPLSLARAFFQAGARAVVASLWRLGDEEAAALFERFYLHLGRGDSVAGALARAQADRRRAGAPAAAWAGVAVLGDGALVPFPGGVPPQRFQGTAIVAGFLLLGLLLAVHWATRTD